MGKYVQVQYLGVWKEEGKPHLYLIATYDDIAVVSYPVNRMVMFNTIHYDNDGLAYILIGDEKYYFYKIEKR